MTNLQFITSVSSTGTSSVDITNIFSDKYDVYCIKSTTYEIVGSASQNLYRRLLDSTGTVISATEYASATLEGRAWDSSLLESRSNGQNYMATGGYINDDSTEGVGFVQYIYNPYNSSSFTFSKTQSSSWNNNSSRGLVMRKGISVHKNAEQITGIRYYVASGTFSFKASVYGVK
jgi:hypothetical protein